MSSPRWIIDDTSRPGHVLCEHTFDPRFTGELLSNDDAPTVGLAIPAPGNRWVCNIRWLDDDDDAVVYEEQDMYDSLAEALAAHEAAKAANGSSRQPVSGTSVTGR